MNNQNIQTAIGLGVLVTVLLVVAFFAQSLIKPSALGGTETRTDAYSTTSATTVTPITTNTTPVKPTPKSMNTAVLHTTKGDIEIELYADKAPKTVKNFTDLIADKFYDGTKFHRVIKDFMIQGGDPLSKTDDTSRYGTGGPGYTFEDEKNGLPVVRGEIAMANSGPNTNGSQFFIVTTKAAPWLDGKHTVFGKVIKGMNVVDMIEGAPKLDERAGIPKEYVVITSAELK